MQAPKQELGASARPGPCRPLANTLSDGKLNSGSSGMLLSLETSNSMQAKDTQLMHLLCGFGIDSERNQHL